MVMAEFFFMPFKLYNRINQMILSKKIIKWMLYFEKKYLKP